MKKIIFLLVLTCFLLSSIGLLLAKNLKSEQEYLQEIGQLLHAGKVDEAQKSNSNMINDYPNSIKAYMGMALIYANQDKLSDAATNVKYALSLSPVSPAPENKNDLFQAHSVLANIYAKQGEIGNAISELTKAVQLKSDSDGAYYMLGVLYTQLKKNKEAREAFQKVVQIGINGESKGVLANYAKQLLEKNKH